MSTILFVTGCGDKPAEPTPAPPPPPPPAPTISAEEQEEKQVLASSGGMFDFIPGDFSVVVGIRPKVLANATTAKQGRNEAASLVAMLERAGLGPDKVELAYTASKRSNDEVLVVLRLTGTLDENAIKEKLVAAAAGEKIDGKQVFSLANEGGPTNGLCFVDKRTVLLGRLKSVQRALEKKEKAESSPLQKAQNLLGMASAPFWVSVSDGLAKKVLAESLVPGLKAENYDAVQSFAMTISDKISATDLKGQKSIQAVFTFERESQAASFQKEFQDGLDSHNSLLAQTRESIDEVKTRGKKKEDEEEEKNSQGNSPGAEPGSSGAGASGTAEDDRRRSESMSSLATTPANPSGAATANQNKSDGDSVKLQGKLVRVSLDYEDGQMGPAISKAIGLARGGTPIDDGIFRGSLATFSDGFKQYWESGKSEELRGARYNDNKDRVSTFVHYSWMCALLPHIGRYDIYDRFDFKKDWTEDPNFDLTRQRIPEFLNPAATTDRWQGYPFAGMALTHFVGMAGVEDKRNDLAANYDRQDPRAGIFGYDEILPADQVTDGLEKTILMIGSEGLAGPWVQAGGSTIRGARVPHFDGMSGFQSAGIEGGGVYVLMADGSMRVVTKDIDPEVFKAMCTAHGGESVDLSANKSN